MSVKTQIVLAVIGVAAVTLPLFFMVGWLKYLVMFAGSITLHAVWSRYAGTPVIEEREEVGFRGFDETNFGDPSQDWHGLNGHDL